MNNNKITFTDRFDNLGDREGVNIFLDGRRFGYVYHLENIATGNTYYSGSTGVGWVHGSTLTKVNSAIQGRMKAKKNFN